MLLKDKNAVIYGGAGAIGGTVARIFAREGANVFLAGRTIEALVKVAEDIRSSGGRAETARMDATDPQSVADHLASTVGKAGGVDISFNLISLSDVQGQELVKMSLDDYMRPIQIGARTHFITATAAARYMTERGRGVIMAMTATPSRLALPLVGGFGTACGAIEGMLRTLAAELGPQGVRVTWLRSAGSPETFGAKETADVDGGAAGRSDNDYLDVLRKTTLLKRFPKASEIGEAAAILASDRASAMTGAAVTLTCGQIVD